MSSSCKSEMVRAARIELASQAWEAHILPMYYARFYLYLVNKLKVIKFKLSKDRCNLSQSIIFNGASGAHLFFLNTQSSRGVYICGTGISSTLTVSIWGD